MRLLPPFLMRWTAWWGLSRGISRGFRYASTSSHTNIEEGGGKKCRGHVPTYAKPPRFIVKLLEYLEGYFYETIDV